MPETLFRQKLKFMDTPQCTEWVRDFSAINILSVPQLHCLRRLLSLVLSGSWDCGCGQLPSSHLAMRNKDSFPQFQVE